MTPEERAAGMSTVDLGSWPEPVPEDPDAIGWREVRGTLVIIGIAAVAFVAAGLVVL